MHTTPIARGSVLSRYFAEIRDYPVLTREEETKLAHDVKRGRKEALDELIRSNLSFVVKVANDYRNLGLPFEDLLNEGNVGLIEAAQRYDTTKGTKLITYAIWWIRKSILKALNEHANLVRVPNYQLKKVRELREAESALRRTLGRKPNREEISRRISRSVAEVEEVIQVSLARHDVSLDDTFGKDEDTPISDFLVDSRLPSAEDELIQQEWSGLVGEALAHLTKQEKTVISYRFGLSGGPALTLKEVGEKMGLSRERIRQIEFKATSRLRKILDKGFSARDRVRRGASSWLSPRPE
jgi:RNA polymerase primary sigma factor